MLIQNSGSQTKLVRDGVRTKNPQQTIDERPTRNTTQLVDDLDTNITDSCRAHDLAGDTAPVPCSHENCVTSSKLATLVTDSRFFRVERRNLPQRCGCNQDKRKALQYDNQRGSGTDVNGVEGPFNVKFIVFDVQNPLLYDEQTTLMSCRPRREAKSST